MDVGSEVHSFLSKNRLYVSKTDSRQLTHTLFDGGKLSVPSEKMSQLMRAISDDLRDGRKVFVNELRTPIFKMFIDFDLLFDVDVSPLFSQGTRVDARWEGNEMEVAPVGAADPKWTRLPFRYETATRKGVGVVDDSDRVWVHLVAFDKATSRLSGPMLLLPSDSFSSTDEEPIRAWFDGETFCADPTSGPDVWGEDTLVLVEEEKEENEEKEGTEEKEGEKTTHKHGRLLFQNRTVCSFSNQTLPPRFLPDEEVSLLYASTQDCFRRFFPKIEVPCQFRCIVSESPSKRANDTSNQGRRGSERRKFGLHFVFQNILVGSHEAMYMREALVRKLETDLGPSLAPLGWAQAVDNAPYVSSGLRMLGSCKTVPCPECNGGSRRKECDSCSGKGKALEEPDGRPYTLRSVFDKGGVDKDATSHYSSPAAMISLLMHNSIRSQSTTKSIGWTKYAGCPEYDEEMLRPGRGGGPPKHPARETVFKEDAKVMRGWKNMSLVTNGDVIRVLQRCVHSVSSCYSKLVVQSVKYDDRHRAYYVTIRGDGENYCLNKGANHRSNRVWFHVGEKGISCRCFCRCNTGEGRKTGKPCSEFSSFVKSISNKDLSLLFPKPTGKGTAFDSRSLVEICHAELFDSKRQKM